MPLSAPTASLDYNKCTSTELRTFIRNRSSLKPSDSEELVHFQKSHLMARLEMLDRYPRFKFLQLPPELRLEVYQYILVARNCEALGDGGQVIETSLLRTCKLVYEEAAPILYGETEFTVEITFPSDSWLRSSNYFRTCSLRDDRYPKGRHYIGMTRLRRPKTNSNSLGFPTSFEKRTIHVASCACFDVLRKVRHLTFFVSRGPLGASRVLAVLCTILSGASKLAKLTIILDADRSSEFDLTRLASDIWSVALLRSDVELEITSEVKVASPKIAEGYGILRSMLGEYRDVLRSWPYHGLEPPGDVISEARKREARMTEDGRVDLISMRHVESMLDELMGSWGIPKAADTFYIRGWVNLQSYVNEDDQSLRSLNRAWKDKC